MMLVAIVVPLLLIFVAFVVDNAHGFVGKSHTFPRKRGFSLSEGVAT